jgi:hypothetical protein
MLVKYKNLVSGEITEEESLFIGQLHEKFHDIDEIFIRAVVKCIENAIFDENELGIVKEGGRVQEKVKLNIMNFFSELKKFSRDVTYCPKINLDLEDDGEDLKFLLELPQKYSKEDLRMFAESYSITTPEVSSKSMRRLVKCVFDAMRDATERGLQGEKSQTPKLRVAAETWGKSYLGKREVSLEVFEVPKADSSHKKNKAVAFKI